ncbi:MAG: hypothetical protein Q9195_000337 [Heterodermia aff. obscurata]
MGDQEDQEMVDCCGGYISDDSSFYGDDHLRATLTQRAHDYDPSTYWQTHPHQPSTIAATARAKASKPPRPSEPTKPFNPYEGQPSSRQLAEPVPDFLSRLPPSTTLPRNTNDPWIRITNPHSPQRPLSEDWAQFTTAANRSLAAFRAARAGIEASGKNKGAIAPLRKQLEAEILSAAQRTGCTTGKWMLFVAVGEVDSVWGKVATGTAEGELGVAAKVAAAAAGGEGRERLICVYTRDFEERGDVGRVVRGLKGLGLLWDGDGKERVIYYKCGECGFFLLRGSSCCGGVGADFEVQMP